MGQFTNVKILGTGAGADARSSTGDSTTGADWTQLNILNLGNLWVSSLSGQLLASSTASSACAQAPGMNAVNGVNSTTKIGAYGYAASGVALSAAAFLPVQLDNGQMFMIPLLIQPRV